jgi:hypothetical protein
MLTARALRSNEQNNISGMDYDTLMFHYRYYRESFLLEQLTNCFTRKNFSIEKWRKKLMELKYI